MAVGKLSYKDWLQKSGRRSSDVQARAWAKWAGKPAPKGRGAPGPPAARRRGPGAATPPYMGYAGAVDPSFGGTPLSLPADSELAWTGTSNPDLASIMQGGWEQLTPKKRPGGGWDVYGVESDPTPQWGKDYLSQLKSREQRHLQYADQTVSPWAEKVLGAAQNANTIQQTNLANMMADVNMNAANAVLPTGPSVSMTGAGSGAGALQDIAGQQAAKMDAGANVAAGAYGAALSNLTAGSAAAQQTGVLSQMKMRLPGQYEQMRMDFSQRLGEITTQIEENRRQREMQRQQLLESRRQFGLTFAEQKRAALSGESIQRRALDIEEDTAQLDAAGNLMDDTARTVPDIRSSLTENETLLDNKGKGFNQRPSMAKFHGRPVQWEQAQDGKWYGIAGKTGKDNAGGGGGEAQADYLKRWRDYSSNIPGMFRGKYHPPKAGEDQGTTEPGSQMSFIDVARDMIGVQGFKPTQVWTSLKPHLMRIRSQDPRGYSTKKAAFVKLLFNSMPGNDSQRILKLRTITGYNAYDLRRQLGLPIGGE